MVKIAVTGKGGVGKTSFSSLLAYVLVEQGQAVYAIDADPNAVRSAAMTLSSFSDSVLLVNDNFVFV